MVINFSVTVCIFRRKNIRLIGKFTKNPPVVHNSTKNLNYVMDLIKKRTMEQRPFKNVFEPLHDKRCVIKCPSLYPCDSFYYTCIFQPDVSLSSVPSLHHRFLAPEVTVTTGVTISFQKNMYCNPIETLESIEIGKSPSFTSSEHNELIFLNTEYIQILKRLRNTQYSFKLNDN